MSDAKRCDRCKDYYDVYHNVKNERYSLIDNDVDNELDLCPRCSKSLERWMSDKYDVFVKEKTVKESV